MRKIAGKDEKNSLFIEKHSLVDKDLLYDMMSNARPAVNGFQSCPLPSPARMQRRIKGLLCLRTTGSRQRNLAEWP